MLCLVLFPSPGHTHDYLDTSRNVAGTTAKALTTWIVDDGIGLHGQACTRLGSLSEN